MLTPSSGVVKIQVEKKKFLIRCVLLQGPSWKKCLPLLMSLGVCVCQVWKLEKERYHTMPCMI